jgi:glycosyltransferase involved in cell wall biosynthesis
MRIAILIPDVTGGGAEFVATEWAEWLVSVGEDVMVLTTKEPVQTENPPGYEVVWIRGDSTPERLRNLRQFMASRRPDVLLALMPYFNLLALTARIGLGSSAPRVVISGRNVESPFRQLFGYRFVAKQAASKIFYPRADAYVAISHPVAAEALALYKIKPGKMFVIPNPATAKYDRRRALLGSAITVCPTPTSEADELNIIVPARLVEQKRPLVAVLVAARLAQTGEKIVLHYYGSGPMEETVRASAESEGVETEFHGWVGEWFAHCPPNSVVLLPSLAEGFGNVLVEAASSGIPCVVSSRCLGASDAVVPGITGELCAGDSIEEYTDAVLRARSIVVGEAAQRWSQRFSAERSGTQLYSVLKSVMVD